ncbi:MAG: alpha/beta hydrolase [Gemmatales bacterium]|nr:alpha/beta hydrolase [Gemmatales bacterium]
MLVWSIFWLALGASFAAEPTVIPLRPDKAPGAVGDKPEDRPNLTVYLPPLQMATGTAVIVCPGGGYGFLAVGHEGEEIAYWLNAQGITAFVLRYRIAPRYRHPAPMQDVQRAIRLVRSRAAEWKLDPKRIGVWGFSAGGHLAATAAVHFDHGNPNSSDPVERVSCRPDFCILAYPVISFTEPFAHKGSRNNLLGPNPDPKLVEYLSLEKHVSPQTPPTFLFHTTEDKPVPSENSIAFYLALRKAGVAAELHIYERGPHGVGLATKDPILRTWPDRLADWLRLHGWLNVSSP